VQDRFGGADVRPLADQEGRQAHGKVLRQFEGVKLELGQCPRFRRKLSRQRGQLVAVLRKRLFERSKGRLGLGNPAALEQDVRLGSCTDLELALQDPELILLRRDNVAGRPELGPERGVPDRRRHDVRGQRDVGAFELELLIIDLGPQRLQLPP
jgi:hypothetical protein